MKELNKDFIKKELLYSKILLGSFLFNLGMLGLLYILQGDVPFWLNFLELVIGLYHIISFGIYIYRVYIYYSSKNHDGVEIWRSIVGVAYSPFGLAFSFFNFMIITLSNVW